MKDKNVFVIGGTSGIGLALSRLLTDRNARCFIGARSAEKAERLPGADYFTWDATGGEIPPDVVPDTVQGLVYCPGTIRLRPISRLTDEDFLEDFNVNLLGRSGRFGAW